MKWGRRRFQKSDGSLTPAGKKRYGDSTSTKSKHRLSLEAQYRAKGMSESEAEAAANKRIRTEKIIAVTAGMTLAACTAYYAKNKYIADRTDQILKAGTTFHNLDSKVNPRPGEHLYVNYRRNDRDYFNGKFAVNKILKSGHVYEHRIPAVDDVKIPSLKTRQSVFKQLCDKDPEFREAMAKHSKMPKNAPSKMIYKNMWQKFGDKDTPYFNEAKAKYFKALKEKGYGAIVDEWDTNRLVYRSDAPLILLDTKHKSLGKMTIRELKEADILTAQANSHNMKLKNNILNSFSAPHTNHFKESYRSLERYSKKSANNRSAVETALFKAKYRKGLFDTETADTLIKADTILGRGKEYEYIGKNLIKNKNMSYEEAAAKARKQYNTRKKVDKYVDKTAYLTGAFAPVIAGSYVKNQRKIDNYRAEHPNTKLTDREIQKLLSTKK